MKAKNESAKSTPDIVITGGKQAAWATTDKYMTVRDAFLKVLPRRKPGLLYDDALKKARESIPATLFPDAASLQSYAADVAKDLERRGIISKVDGTKQWVRSD